MLDRRGALIELSVPIGELALQASDRRTGDLEHHDEPAPLDHSGTAPMAYVTPLLSVMVIDRVGAAGADAPMSPE